MLQIEKSLGCEFCTATFHTQEMFNIHNRLHVKQSLMCVICKAVFSTMASMRVHLWKAHAISKSDQQRSIASLDWAADSFAPTKESKITTPFKCCRCNKSFKYKFSIARHLRSHRKKGELFGGINPVQPISDPTYRGQINCSSLSVESAETEEINNQTTDISEDPKSPGSSDSITLNLSVDDKGPATHLGYLQDNARSHYHLSKKPNSTRQRYECGHCGASFRFDFSYEAHVRQHSMMDT